MIRKFLIAPALALFLFGADQAMADACSNRARQVVAKTPGAVLLAVQSAKNANGKIVCVARIQAPPQRQ